LIEESFVTGGGEKRLEIVVTPLKKRAGRMRKRKRSIEVVEKAETGSSPAKKSKYPLRNRSKHQRFAGLQQLADEASVIAVSLHHLVCCSWLVLMFIIACGSVRM